MPALYVMSGMSCFAREGRQLGDGSEFPLVCEGAWDICLDHPETFKGRCAGYRKRLGRPQGGGQYPAQFFPFTTALSAYSERKLLQEISRAVDAVRLKTEQHEILVAVDWIESEPALRAARRVADRTGARVVGLAGEHRCAELEMLAFDLADRFVTVHQPKEYRSELSPAFEMTGAKGVDFFEGYNERDNFVVPWRMPDP